MKDGKVRSTAAINWKDTMELWENDPRAAANKILIRHKNLSTSRYSFRIQTFKRTYLNNEFFSLWYKRTFKRKFAKRIGSYRLPKIEVEKIKVKTRGK